MTMTTTGVAFPVSSVRSDPRAIVTACEDWELSGAVGGAAGGGQPQFVELAELAALLYLSSYTHARQLWKRRQPPADLTNSSANPELHQFTLLWEAVQPLIAPEEQSENAANKNGEATAMAQLGACVSAGQQPLATYADDILKKWRSEKIDMMEECYDTVRMQDCAALLGYTADDAGREEMANALRGRGWTVSGECWVPGDAEEEEEDEEEKKEEEDDVGGVGAADRIKELADIVGFMEMSKLNL